MSRRTLDEVARERISNWIRTSTLSQELIATTLGRSQSWLSRYLKGEFNADLETLRAFAQIFNVPFIALFDQPDDPEEAEHLRCWRSLPRELRMSVSDLVAKFARPLPSPDGNGQRTRRR